MSRTNQILIWLTLSVLTLSLTTAYFWPEKEGELLVEEEEIQLQIEPEKITQLEDLVVTVLNGSQRGGLAGKTQDYLATQNIYVTRVGNAPTRDYAVSEIIYHPESAQAAYELAKLLRINKRTPASSFDSKLFATVVLGTDFIEPAIAEESESPT